jgi:hypothetical protein
MSFGANEAASREADEDAPSFFFSVFVNGRAEFLFAGSGFWRESAGLRSNGLSGPVNRTVRGVTAMDGPEPDN